MRTFSREDVLLLIPHVFPHEDLATITELLDLYGAESYENERERVQMAILKLSNGDIDRLLANLALAKRDYRDVLMAAEYA